MIVTRQECSPPRQLRRLLPAVAMLLGASHFVVLAAPPSSAHMIAPGYNHIGNHPGTGNRFFQWFDETGHGGWVAAEGRWAQTYYNYWAFWNRDRGVPVPYLDYRTSGGSAGCFNDQYALDYCLGDPGSGHAALARWATDSASHVVRGNVIQRDGYTDRQKESIVCQEVSHILGLDHNEHFSTSASQSCMYPFVTSNPSVSWDVHDDESFRQFYSGHQP